MLPRRFRQRLSALGACAPAIALCLGLAACGMSGPHPGVALQDPDTTAGLLREDWAAVAERLDKSPGGHSPLVRAVRAHALLALNRNNESLCLLRDLDEPGDLRAWRDWTQAFVAANPKRPVAHYLAGDALARLGQWDAAIAEFTRALELRPDHTLALNARGVVHIARGQWDDALKDFERAEKGNPAFTDASANRGTLWLQRNALGGALSAFDRALGISPDFVLAVTGRVSVLAAQFRLDDAEHDLNAADRMSPCARALRAENLSQILAYMQGRSLVAQADSGDAGTTVDKAFHTLTANPTQGNFNRLVDSARGDLGSLDHARGLLQNYAKTNPVEAGKLLGMANTNVRWNAGPAQTVINVLSGFENTLSVGAKVGGIEARDTLKYSAGTFAHKQSDITMGNLMVGRGFESALSQGLHVSSGGVTSNMAAAPVDVGDWPFVTRYGLLYPVAASTEPKEARAR